MEIQARLCNDDINRIVDILTGRLVDLLSPLKQSITSLKEKEERKVDTSSDIMPDHLRQDYFTYEELRDIFDLSFHGVKPYRQQGLLNPVKFGRRMFFRRSEVEKILSGESKLK
jgi:hypothetical protein